MRSARHLPSSAPSRRHRTSINRTNFLSRRYFLVVALAVATGFSASGDLSAEADGASPPSSLSLVDLTGQKRSLDQFRGRVVIVNFWASWCPPCLREFPSLQRFRRGLSDRPIEIIAVNSGEPKALVERFQRRFQNDFVMLLDTDRRETKAWQVEFFPTTFVLDPQGRIIQRISGEMDWDNEETRRPVEELLPDRPPLELYKTKL